MAAPGRSNRGPDGVANPALAASRLMAGRRGRGSASRPGPPFRRRPKPVPGPQGLRWLHVVAVSPRVDPWGQVATGGARTERHRFRTGGPGNPPESHALRRDPASDRTNENGSRARRVLADRGPGGKAGPFPRERRNAGRNARRPGEGRRPDQGTSTPAARSAAMARRCDSRVATSPSTAATESQRPGMARLPVTSISQVQIAGVKPPKVAVASE